MTPSQKNSQKNEKALAALHSAIHELKTTVKHHAKEHIYTMPIEETIKECQQAIATLSEPETVGGEVVTVEREEIELVMKMASKRGEQEPRVVDAIHALIQSRVGER